MFSTTTIGKSYLFKNTNARRRSGSAQAYFDHISTVHLEYTYLWSGQGNVIKALGMLGLVGYINKACLVNKKYKEELNTGGLNNGRILCVPPTYLAQSTQGNMASFSCSFSPLCPPGSGVHAFSQARKTRLIYYYVTAN